MARGPLSASPIASDLVILDFDGVVADSELLSNTLLAMFLTSEGLPTSTEESMTRYMGRRWDDNLRHIETAFGGRLPDAFQERHRAFVGGRMRRDVEPVPGVVAFLAANPDQAFCVASSSSIDWLNHGADKFALRSSLGGNLFSAASVARGKPAPDIFLHAAEQMNTPPARCVVIEDSAAGVAAGVAAGMTVIGFLGGAHVRDGHDNSLLMAGAHHIARHYGDVARLAGLRLLPENA